ncbi:MAG: tryptophan 7-halogenase [Alteromonadaceae bacterium]|nr:tryptophan 7-halogenase [Alteromonadaceae bacterium]
MNDNQIKDIVIVGGGSSGWMAAAMLAKTLGKGRQITLIESESIGILGVGEATIPPIRLFNNALGINEVDFIRHTQATFKLGIQFENWGAQGESYMHAFGDIGRGLGFTSFHHYWLQAQKMGNSSGFWDYSLNYQAAKANKFTKMEQIAGTPLSGIAYAYHFDAVLYADFLRKFSEQLGVKRIEGKVVETNLQASTGAVDDGFIRSVTLENGEHVTGDLFIDCTGFSALLIEKALKTGFTDWSHWLPMDRAIAVPTESNGELIPYTRSIAHKAGWQWQIPLQHRVGNGHVYCSKYTSDEEAKQTLLNNLSGKMLAEPRMFKFTTGMRKKLWNKNCVAIGLSSGFLEPLESTALHLVQASITRLIILFPDKQFHQADVDEFNRQSTVDYEKIRDFIILHYRATKRDDSAFWQACQKLEIPESLQQKIDLFKSHGRIFREQNELFSEAAWQQVMLGQGLMPKSVHPVTEQLSREQLEEFLNNLTSIINKTVGNMPDHGDFIAKHCAS